jgi:hypothetical protein
MRDDNRSMAGVLPLELNFRPNNVRLEGYRREAASYRDFSQDGSLKNPRSEFQSYDRRDSH